MAAAKMDGECDVDQLHRSNVRSIQVKVHTCVCMSKKEREREGAR